ncbi:MAG: SAVED domain-containing protein [Bacteroidota bacterium]
MTILDLFKSKIIQKEFSFQDEGLVGRKMRVDSSEDVEILLKTELAIFLQISQKGVLDVKKFLNKKRMDATLLVMQPKDGNAILDVDHRDDWEDIVRDFSRLLDCVYEQFRPKSLHIFLAVPASLAFGIGCTIRNLRRPHIYHYSRERESYKLVLVADDSIK